MAAWSKVHESTEVKKASPNALSKPHDFHLATKKVDDEVKKVEEEVA